MAIAIKTENLSKAYQLGEFSTGTLSRDIERWWYKLRGKEDPFVRIGETNDRTTKGISDIVWSLKDIDFEIEQGDAVGIIGRNGAGKSTLLKILSRVTSPTTGSAKIKGRIASLLEVGTGFHPELTGQENIYLNGAILGMRKKEIKRKFDEIVNFSGVERYIDTPVKRYSSGMYVRLAFAVAAHLESEILIVDEVLAVGDAEFQKKCLVKMDDVSKGEGRTVLFVSHNMSSIQTLCKKCMYLKDGFLAEAPDETEVILSKYLRSMGEHILNIPVLNRTDREGEGELMIIDIRILDKMEHEVTNLISGQQTTFLVQYTNVRKQFDEAPLEIAIAISRNGEHLVTVLSTKYLKAQIKNTADIQSVNFIIDKLPLMTGTYSMNVMLRKNDVIQDWVREAKIFEVENGDYYKTGLNIPESHKGVYINYTIEK
jgi:lipopolysaccharide transport system ATP-binding protein